MQRTFLLIIVLLITFLEATRRANDTTTKTVSTSPQNSALLDKSARARQLHLTKVFGYLKIRRNSKVADVGAGHGWLTVRLAPFVGTQGKVYAVEVLPRYVTYIQEEIIRQKLSNVEVILGSMTDPKLPKNTLDAVMILIAYHEFEKPLTMLTKIRKAMKAGARLGIVEWDSDEMRTRAREAYARTGYISDRINETMTKSFFTDKHSLALDIVKKETMSVGFKFLFARELGGDYYIAVFANSK